jgi:hypothetical protein
MSTSAERAREFVEAGFRSLGVPSLEPYIEVVAELLEHERALAIEEAAKIVEGRVYKDIYREWPEYGLGNRSREHETVKLCDALAAALRTRAALATAKPGGE